MMFNVTLIYLLLFLSGPISAASDTNFNTSRTAEETKSLFVVVPRKHGDIDVSATFDFIKATVQEDNLKLSMDVDERLLSWIVNATTDQVGNLRDHGAIERVIPLTIPELQPEQRLPQGDPVKHVTYKIYAMDGSDFDQCIVVGATLKVMLGDQLKDPCVYNEAHVVKHWVGGWTARLSPEQVEKVRGLDYVKSVCPPRRGRRGAKPRKLHGHAKAAYETQTDAATELVAISQPSTIPDLDDLSNYVYEDHPDGASYVYFVETGVAFLSPAAEFPRVSSQHILTQNAIENGKQPFEDEDDTELPSHGTCCAGKALGTRFGAAKKATLIVVKLDDLDYTEFEQALDLIIADLDQHPDRQKRSVVTMSTDFGTEWSDEEQEEIRKKLQRLFARDVPFVVLAGNYADEDPEVNGFPQALEGPDVPLIVVGSVDALGNRSDFSQAGPHVTVHALGEDISCLPKEEGAERLPGEISGTSYAAPIVAGELANLLSADTVPFDTSDGNLVKNAKSYLQSDLGSWERFAGIGVLWNGVTEADNPSADTAVASVKCTGLESDVYVERDDVADLIENDFCPTSKLSGTLHQDLHSVSRTYNVGMPNQVTLSMDLGASLGKHRNPEDCITYLMMAVDNCDVSSEGNPANYKGGGLTTVGERTYRVSPSSLRAEAENGKQSGCDSAYKVLFNQYRVWGHGWASSDHGKSLKDKIKSCALLPDTWDFHYGLGEDGREWTARFRTGVFQKSCVGNAVGTAAGIDDMECSGSGY